MKRLKFLTILTLIVVILMVGTMTSFATDDVNTKILEIYDYFDRSIYAYGLYGVPDIQAPVDGEVYLTYTSESVKAMKILCVTLTS